MNDKRIQTPHDELTYKIIGCAMAVHRTLGPGLREDTYQRDLGVKFDEGKMEHEPQKLLEVYDSSQGNILIGYYIPDFRSTVNGLGDRIEQITPAHNPFNAKRLQEIR